MFTLVFALNSLASFIASLWISVVSMPARIGSHPDATSAFSVLTTCCHTTSTTEIDLVSLTLDTSNSKKGVTDGTAAQSDDEPARD